MECTDILSCRLADARSLHDKLLYEKAKLELKRLKLNKLCVCILVFPPPYG